MCRSHGVAIRPGYDGRECLHCGKCGGYFRPPTSRRHGGLVSFVSFFLLLREAVLVPLAVDVGTNAGARHCRAGEESLHLDWVFPRWRRRWLFGGVTPSVIWEEFWAWGLGLKVRSDHEAWTSRAAVVLAPVCLVLIRTTSQARLQWAMAIMGEDVLESWEQEDFILSLVKRLVL